MGTLGRGKMSAPLLEKSLFRIRSRTWTAGVAKETILLGLIFLLAAVLRLGFIGRQSMWVDEAASFWKVNRSWEQMFAGFSSGTFRPLYFVALRLSLPLGSDEWILRLPSALVGLLSIYLFYRLGSALFDRSTGLVAALLLAVSPIHVWYSQEVRMYSLVGLLCVGAGLFAWRALRGNRFLDWFLLGLLEGLVLWTESAGIWLVFSLNGAALLVLPWLWRERRLWPWFASQVLALLIYAPLLRNFLGTMSGGDALWIPPATILVLARLVTDFAGSFWRTPLESRLILLCLIAWLLSKGVDLWREAYRKPVRYTFLACALILPVVISFTVSQPYLEVPLLDLIFTPGRSVFLPRNLILVIFPLYLFLARSLFLGRRQPGLVILISLVILNLLACLGNLLPERKEDYRAAAQLVAELSQPGDVILLAPGYLELPFDYYYLDHQEAYGLSLGSLQDGVLTEQEASVYPVPLQAINGRSRAWVLTTTNIYQQDTQGITAGVAATGELVGTWQFEGVNLSLYDLES
jgi:mannosyltransferase